MIVGGAPGIGKSAISISVMGRVSPNSIIFSCCGYSSVRQFLQSLYFYIHRHVTSLGAFEESKNVSTLRINNIDNFESRVKRLLEGYSKFIFILFDDIDELKWIDANLPCKILRLAEVYSSFLYPWNYLYQLKRIHVD